METNVLDTLNMVELGKRLQQARKRRGFTQADAAEELSLARTTLTAIEKGERRLKADELIRLARLYGQQVSDFVRPQPKVEPFAVQFRSAFRRTAEDDEQIAVHIQEFEDLCRDYRNLELLVGTPLVYRYPPEYKVTGLPLEQAAELVAQSERKRLGLGDGPVLNLRTFLEQDVGLRIFYMEMRPSHKFSAMYAFGPELGGCIAVNVLHPEERRRSSISHDYAHFLQNRHKAELLAEDAYQRRPESERFADLFAFYFLMPTDGLKRRYQEIVQSQAGRFTAADLCTVAHFYGVSVEAMAQRLEGMKLLRTGTWDQLRSKGFRVRKAQEELGLAPLPASDNLLPMRYQYLAIQAYELEKITEGQLARFLRVDRLEARRVVASLHVEASLQEKDTRTNQLRSDIS